MPDVLSTAESLDQSSSQEVNQDTGVVTDDKYSIGRSENIVENEAKTIDPAAWKYDENIPGTGDKPDWFNSDKYANVTEQAKAYPSLLKKFGSFTGAPDEYSLEKYKDKVDPESAFLKNVMESAKKMEMSQGGFESLIDLFVNYEEANLANPEDFVKSLNAEQTEMARNIIGWATNNFSEEEFSEIANMMTTPERLGILAKMRAMTREQRTPSTNTYGSMPTSSDIRSKIINNYEQYKNDEAFRSRLDKEFAEAMEREGKA